MGCIRVEKITEHLCEPLRKCLKDEDPYVRKTAAVCVAKLYDINQQLVDDQGFLDMLRDLISDSNPMVGRCAPDRAESVQCSALGRGQCCRCPERNRGAVAADARVRSERTDDQQADDGAERMHGMGPGVHSGRDCQLLAEGLFSARCSGSSVCRASDTRHEMCHSRGERQLAESQAHLVLLK